MAAHPLTCPTLNGVAPLETTLSLFSFTFPQNLALRCEPGLVCRPEGRCGLKWVDTNTRCIKLALHQIPLLASPDQKCVSLWVSWTPGFDKNNFFPVIVHVLLRVLYPTLFATHQRPSLSREPSPFFQLPIYFAGTCSLLPIRQICGHIAAHFLWNRRWVDSGILHALGNYLISGQNDGTETMNVILDTDPFSSAVVNQFTTFGDVVDALDGNLSWPRGVHYWQWCSIEARTNNVPIICFRTLLNFHSND